ncbi:IS1380 family transposase, partial [Actinoplanes sp. ATCC 53533]|uniref:transposase n=1 Tax=Actinoplanes sp. ATCC 53533 TaxID=1288362 RepID=UPI00100280B8
IGFGHAKVGGYNVYLRGYNPLITTISTPLSAPVIAATRLRSGNAGSARGAASMIAEAITTARSCGASGEIVVRADSAFYTKTVITTCWRRDVRFSVTTRIDAKIRTACDSISDDQWLDIKYPRAVFDEDQQRWISDAQIAETVYTAFAGTRHAVTARLIVRRIRRDDPTQIPGQEELVPTYRYHAVFTDSPFTLVQAESQHRGPAIIEQVNADLIAGPLAHLPSGRFSANDAWLTCA